MDVLSSVLSSSDLTSHELYESVGPAAAAESSSATADPAIIALDTAHVLAFRSGLGNLLFTAPQGSLAAEDVRSFAAKAFTKENVAALGYGISSPVLTSLIQEKLSGLPSQGGIQSGATKYYGGEARIESHSKPALFIGYGTSTPSAGLSVLAAHLDPTPSLKWAQGTSPLSPVLPGASVRIVHETYSDGALLGVLVQAATVEAVREAGKLAAKALKDASSIGKEGLQKAIRKAKFKAASALEGRETITATIAPQLFTGKDVSVGSTLKSLEGVTEDDVTKTARALASGKVTYVAVGSGSLPYADELGL